MVPEGYIQRTLQLAAQGVTEIHFPEYDTDWDSEAYLTVAGQNSNNSVRVPNEFFDVLASGRRVGRSSAAPTAGPSKTLPAAALWDEIAYAAWACADPGVQYDTTINEWHTCPEDGRINASNPCVTGDTLVATADGWRRIDALVGTYRRASSAPTALPHLVTRVFPTGRKPVFRLTHPRRLSGPHHRRPPRADGGAAATWPSRDLTADDRLILQGPGFGRRTLGSGAGARDRRRGGRWLPDAARASSGREQDVVILTMHAGEAAVLDAVAAAVNVEKAALKAVGSVGRNDGVAGHARRAPARGWRSARDRSSICSASSRCSTRDRDGKRFTPDGLRPGPARARRDAARPLHRRRHRGQLRRASRSTSASTRARRSCSARSSSCCSRSASSPSSTTAGAATRPRPSCPTATAGAASIPSSRCSRCGSAGPRGSLFEREIGFHPASPKAAALARLNAEVGAYRDELTDAVASIEPAGEEDVFDLTEDATHHFVAGGLVVHNCSEYMFLDDTACNLASINLVKFLREDGSFDVEGFRHACRLWTIVLEISVLMARIRAPPIAQKSCDFRTLGLGYANMGTLLMRKGIPYDSPRGRGHLRRDHRDHERRGLRHLGGDGARPRRPSPASRRTASPCCASCATTGGPPTTRRASEYEGLTITPVGIDPAHCPAAAARGRARDLGPGARRSARRTATATPRSRCSRRPAPSASSWTATPPASSPTSPSSSSRSSRAAATSRSSTRACPWRCATLGYAPRPRSTTSWPTAWGAGTLARRAVHQPRDARARKGFDDATASPGSSAALEAAFDITFAFNAWTLGEDYVRAAARPQRGAARRVERQPAPRARASPRPRSRRPTTTAAAP